MRFSDFGIALIAMAGSANAQWKGNPAMKLKDVRPGHIEDMEALHKSIQRCVLSIVPIPWTPSEKQLDLFCDSSVGKWHQQLPVCIGKAYPFGAEDIGIAEYNYFLSRLCDGYTGPGGIRTEVFTIADSATTTTIYPTTTSENMYLAAIYPTTSSENMYLVSSTNTRFPKPTTSHACLPGKEICRMRDMDKPLYTTRSKSKKWRKSSFRKIYTGPPGTAAAVTTAAAAMPTK